MFAQKQWMTAAGWVIAGLIGALVLFGATLGFIKPETTEPFTSKFGYPKEVLLPILIVELCCVILFLVPRTTVLGAVLLAGYLGGAIATHVRVHDNFAMPAVVGVLVWLSVYLRDPRVRAILPLRSKAPASS